MSLGILALVAAIPVLLLGLLAYTRSRCPQCGHRMNKEKERTAIGLMRTIADLCPRCGFRRRLPRHGR